MYRPYQIRYFRTTKIEKPIDNYIICKYTHSFSNASMLKGLFVCLKINTVENICEENVA